MSLKILICGDVEGKFDELLKRVTNIEKKSGKFETLFCIGNFFGENSAFIKDYMDGKKVCNTATLIVSTIPDSLKDIIDPNGSSLCPNITYLGNKGTCKFENKLSIAYLSGDTVVESDVRDICHQMRCTSLGYSGIDLLLTNVWPIDVENDGNPLPNGLKSREWGSESISALSILLQPRYHFTANKKLYYERIPFKNKKSNQMKHVTRFLSLSSFKNPKNDKYLYALQLAPMETMAPKDLLQIPANATESPYINVDSSSYLNQSTNQFFFDNNNKKRKVDDDLTQHCDNKKQNKTSNEISVGCWFCLGNPEVEKHLIVNVGALAYLAMPRGALVKDHLMILPVGHHQSLVTCPKEVLKEVKKIIVKVTQYFESQNKSVVFFERNYKSNHFQLQVVPIDREKLESCKKLFVEMSIRENGPGENFRAIPSKSHIQEITKPGVPYFYVQYSDGDKFFGTIPRTQFASFDLQFGRIVLSDPLILNCRNRAQWKNCLENKDTEEKMSKTMKLALCQYFNI